MRTFRKSCASSNPVRTFEGPPALTRNRLDCPTVLLFCPKVIKAESSRCARFIRHRHRVQGRALAQKKSRAFNLARLRIGEIYSLWLYRISILTSLIICDEVESFKIKRFLALRPVARMTA
jgi:hypothetical protein